MPPADIVTISIQAGKTRETPARTSAPRRPTKKASTVLEAAWTVTTTTLGAARRRSVGRMGASSSSRVRAGSALTTGTGAAGGEITIWLMEAITSNDVLARPPRRPLVTCTLQITPA